MRSLPIYEYTEYMPSSIRRHACNFDPHASHLDQGKGPEYRAPELYSDNLTLSSKVHSHSRTSLLSTDLR